MRIRDCSSDVFSSDLSSWYTPMTSDDCCWRQSAGPALRQASTGTIVTDVQESIRSSRARSRIVCQHGGRGNWPVGADAGIEVERAGHLAEATGRVVATAAIWCGKVSASCFLLDVDQV